jgi:hypothetical protein
VTSLAQRHGGRTTVASEGLGKGSAFTISLPLTRAEIETAGKLPPEPPHEEPKLSLDSRELEGLRVLIVDDDLDASNMLKFALQSSGAEIRTSSSVSDALLSIEEWIPSALLTDINMPEGMVIRLSAGSAKPAGDGPIFDSRNCFDRNGPSRGRRPEAVFRIPNAHTKARRHRGIDEPLSA